MALAELNVRIGARIEQLEKGLRRADRSIQGFARRMDQVGNQLTLAISAPLAAIAGLSLKTAADFDVLEKGITTAMTSAGRSIQDAANEIDELRKISNNPGLTFDNLLKGSIKLQSVGFSAEDARRSLEVFGNALALAGGNAQDLDGVNLALTQIVSKGNVFAEEINQIAERVPQVRKAMISAFGTARTEDIQKLNLASEDFIKIITEELAKLPKAPETLANSFKNLRQNVEQAAVRIGGAIEESFNVSGKIARFAEFIEDTARAFSELNPALQKGILYSAGFLAALGPIAKATSFVIDATKLYSTALTQLQVIALKTQVNVAKLAASYAAAVGPIGVALTAIAAVGGVVFAAYKAYENYNNALDANIVKQKTANDLNLVAEQAIARERLEVERLADVLKTETSTKEQRAKAITELNRISPEYFGGLKDEATLVGDVEAAMKGYIEQLKQRAKLQAANERLVEIEKEILNVQQRISEGGNFFDELKGAVLGFGNAGGQAAAKYSLLADELKGLQNQKNALLDILGPVNATQEANVRVNTSIDSGQGIGREQLDIPSIPVNIEIQPLDDSNINTIEEQAARVREVLNDLYTPPGINPLTAYGEELDLIRTKSDALGESYNAQAAELQLLQTLITDAIESGYTPLNASIEELIGKYEQVEKAAIKAEKRQDRAMNATTVAQATFLKFANAQIKTFGDLGRIAVQVAKDIIAAEFAKAVASYISDSFSKLGIFGAVLAAAAGGVVGAAFSAIPAFAQGGMVTGEQLALVGDNPSGKEAIIPFERMGEFAAKLVEPQGRQVYIPDVRISGSDLVLVFEEQQRKNARYGS